MTRSVDGSGRWNIEWQFVNQAIFSVTLIKRKEHIIVFSLFLGQFLNLPRSRSGSNSLSFNEQYDQQVSRSI